ncbi:MAG: RIP metalloprotease RseP [Gammaproteobacteria bacterium]|nr:RIP metalloprotease RseP [Gammaproteobacteria bacterium]
MLEFIYSIVGFIIALGILVVVHEFGHFWVARKLGIKVLKFSVGFGRAIWSRTANDGTIYALGILPLGGYVKMLDESEGEVAEKDKSRAFNRQPIWKRMLVVLAGPMFNFLFAIAAYSLVFAGGMEGLTPVVGKVVEGSVAESDGFRSGDVLLSVDGRKLNMWQEQRLYLFSKALARKTVQYEVQTRDGRKITRTLNLADVPMSKIDARLVAGGIGLIAWYPTVPPVIDRVVNGKPAFKAGLKQGDLITAIDDEKISSWDDVVRLVSASPGRQLKLDITRNGYPESIFVTPEAVMDGDRELGRIGISVQPVSLPEDRRVMVNYGLMESLYRGTETTWMMSLLTLRMLGKMLTLEVSSKNISGPITIAQYAGKSAQVGFSSFMLFLAIVSVSLGVLNLLPIPILDGGHLLYYSIEAVTRKPVPEKVMIWGQQVGILLLFLLMSLAVYNDLGRLFS